MAKIVDVCVRVELPDDDANSDDVCSAIASAVAATGVAAETFVHAEHVTTEDAPQ